MDKRKGTILAILVLAVGGVGLYATSGPDAPSNIVQPAAPTGPDYFADVPSPYTPKLMSGPPKVFYAASPFSIDAPPGLDGGGGADAAGADAGDADPNNMSSIAFNITSSIAYLPGLLTGLSYLFAMILGTKAILRIRQHMENPSQIPLKNSIAVMATAGALFALPIIYEAMHVTVGTEATATVAAEINAVAFNTE